MKYCAKVLLVGLDEELPSDPSVAYSGTPPIIGCNNLVCGKCGATVRHADGCSTTSGHAPHGLAELYDSRDPRASPLLNKGPSDERWRTYFCRCAWADSGADMKFVAMTDAPWKCGGHPDGESRSGGTKVEVVDARDIHIAEARKATDDLIAATVPIMIPETGAKIRMYWAPNVEPEFASASELRDALLASYPEAKTSGVPVVVTNRGEDTKPAWGWVETLLLQRTDWWQAAGIALQHAATDGGPIAQTALVELLAHYNRSIVLLPWTAPMAKLWPDRKTVDTPATGWGSPKNRLDDVIRDQKKYVKDIHTGGDGTTFLDSYGADGKDIIAPLKTEADLRALLVETAHAGRNPGGGTGPWSWLAFEFLIGEDWLRPAFERIVNTLDDKDQTMILALLDWFFEEQDLWKLAPLLSTWHSHPPSWWSISATTVPPNWKYNIRSGHWPDCNTLGDVATEALRRAKWQLVTPPVVNLPQLYR